MKVTISIILSPLAKDLKSQSTKMKSKPRTENQNALEIKAFAGRWVNLTFLFMPEV